MVYFSLMVHFDAGNEGNDSSILSDTSDKSKPDKRKVNNFFLVFLRINFCSFFNF